LARVEGECKEVLESSADLTGQVEAARFKSGKDVGGIGKEAE
jgi:hypothetical protein